MALKITAKFLQTFRADALARWKRDVTLTIMGVDLDPKQARTMDELLDAIDAEIARRGSMTYADHLRAEYPVTT
jgi:hypothetical protein